MSRVLEKILLFIAGSILLVAPKAFAADENLFFCAQVIPCDENGKLLPQFNDPKSACFDRYLSACHNMQLSQEMNSCEATSQKLSLRIKKLESQNRRLKRRSVRN